MLKYTMLIEYSEADHCYVVTLPQWQSRGVLMPCTHGDTYVEAATHGQEVLETLIDTEKEGTAWDELR